MSAPLSQVGMDKALNQLSVPLGQLREEIMVCVLINCKLYNSIDPCHWGFMHVPGFGLLQSLRSCVSEVIQAIDNQLSKQEDLQKKKVWLIFLLSDHFVKFGHM